MRVTLRYFAAIRQAMGVDSAAHEIEGQTDIAYLISSLRTRDGQLDRVLSDTPRVRFAVNRRFAAMDTLLNDGDELAIFPPITGG